LKLKVTFLTAKVNEPCLLAGWEGSKHAKSKVFLLKLAKKEQYLA
tara:strand:- start:3591 stop:3725 length:135 start_codon:yes stop_codon:yes gene_type:complete